jgi:hypothetical protein
VNTATNGRVISKVLLGLWLGIWAAPAAGQAPAAAWQDNQRKFASDDPNYNFRRSDHFRIAWGKAAAKRKDENADFAKVSEQLAQGNLQMLEQVWHKYHEAAPKGIGFHVPANSCNPKFQDGNSYRDNLVMNNTGIWAGGAWGACDDWGFPLFALPPSYLRFDPPSGATPHEYGHTALINAGGFNDTPYDGMWHEATANWLQLQFENSYPGPGGVGTQPFLSVPHGRNYYDSWQIWEYFKEDPRYGYAFVNKVWTEARGNKAKGGEYIFDAMARMDTSGSPDKYNAIKDALGHMAARNVMWDYQRQAYFQKHSPRTMDPMTEMYRRAYTELTRRGGDGTWYRVPFAHAPMQGGYNVVPIALNGKAGAGGYTVSVNFQPLWDATRRSDWRATLVAVSDGGESRYSTMWNGGVNSITLAADENQLFLAVAATPDFMPFEGFSHPLVSDLPLQPQAYEVAFVNTKAGPYETKHFAPRDPRGALGSSSRDPRGAPVLGKPHPNGKGFVADSATVELTAYVGPDAMVLGSAKVLGSARIEDYAVVAGSAVVKDHALLSGHALVRDTAQVYDHGKVRDWATVQGKWQVYENGRALERAWLHDKGELHGHATIKGNVPDFGGASVRGHAIKDGDCANSANVDHQVLLCWVWGIDQKYADSRPDTHGLYCCYHFARHSPVYALDDYGVMHGYLMGSPALAAVDPMGCIWALRLDGKTQYVELKRDVADFRDTTIAAWVNWAGSPGDQRIFHFGDGGAKYAYLTPKDPATGKCRFVITTTGKAGEQVLEAPAALPAGTWTNVAVTLKDDTGTLYINGKAVATNPAMTLNTDQVLAANTLAGNDCVFLGRGDTGGYFHGLLTDFRVYVQPQDAAEIAARVGAWSGVEKDRTAETITGPDGKPHGPFTGMPAPQSAPATGRFLLPPTVAGEAAVVMSAPRTSDDIRWAEYSFKWAEYSFTCTAGGGHNSGWISSNRWTDCGLESGKIYAYTFRTRDEFGNQSPPSPAATVTIPKDTDPPSPAEFEAGPAGISTTAIRMTARKAKDASALVEYQFTRSDGKVSGWQAGRTWTDTGLTEGVSFSYTVLARDGAGNVSKPSAAKPAVARDDTPPARYAIGEWQSLPYATLDNCLAMRAMSVTGEDGCPKIEPDPVEYFFHCTAGGGPDSGWIEKPFWQSPAVPDGTYTYQFKIRDKSPQHNETPYSSAETVVVSPLTGYHEYAVPKLAALPEGALVSFKGKVTAVDATAYTVTADGATIKVMPKTPAGVTNPELKGKDVAVKGCVWVCKGQKRVTWAEVE